MNDTSLDINDDLSTEVGCKTQQDELSRLQAEAEKRGEQFQQEGSDLGKGDDLSLKFNIEWERVDVRFHVPEVKWSQRDIKFDAPKVYSKRVDISFDYPVVEWDVTVVGWYIKCRKLKCRKEEIKTKIPKTYKKTKTVSFDVPDIEWATTSIPVPERVNTFETVVFMS